MELGAECRIDAVIYVGASSLSLLIGQDSPEGYSEVDFLTHAIPLARDIFRVGSISKETTERCVEIIDGYSRALHEYAPKRDMSVRVMATNIIKEASNKDSFLDRIRIANGYNIEALDDGEMTRLIYLRIRNQFKDSHWIRQKQTVVVHVGPGNTRILVFAKGRVVRYGNYRLGTHRTGEVLDNSDIAEQSSLWVTREHIRSQIEQIKLDFAGFSTNMMLAVGLELQALAPFFIDQHGSISVEDFAKFAHELAAMTTEERMRRYGVDYAAVVALLPSIVTNLALAECFGCKTLYVPKSMYEPGLMIDMLEAGKTNRDFEDEVLHFAEGNADRYHADVNHRRHVTYLADSLFSQLSGLHKLRSHERLLLKVAAILHEVGLFIAQPNHQKHSEYIILNTDLFGLSNIDVQQVALLTRYHRHDIPQDKHPIYHDLSPENRLKVSKLASLLRLADALERSHTQRIKSVNARVVGRRLELVVSGVRDVTLEELALQGKSDLFTNLFGLEVSIIPAV